SGGACASGSPCGGPSCAEASRKLAVAQSPSVGSFVGCAHPELERIARSARAEEKRRDVPAADDRLRELPTRRLDAEEVGDVADDERGARAGVPEAVFGGDEFHVQGDPVDMPETMNLRREIPEDPRQAGASRAPRARFATSRTINRRADDVVRKGERRGSVS